MTDATTRIKNLSIALEAVSKLHHDGFVRSLEALLYEEIHKLKEKKGINLTARPAKTSPNNPLFNT